jgi:uncharacterized protein YkwD
MKTISLIIVLICLNLSVIAQSLETYIVNEVNKERAKQRLKLLTWTDAALYCAKDQSDYLVRSNDKPQNYDTLGFIKNYTQSHDQVNKSYVKRLKQYGLSNLNVAECLVSLNYNEINEITAKKAVSDLMHSPSHRKILMANNINQISIAYSLLHEKKFFKTASIVFITIIVKN